jgi:hypothetical protein
MSEGWMGFFIYSIGGYSDSYYKDIIPKFETNIPRKEIARLSPNFHIHVSASDLYIPTTGLPNMLQKICGPILGIYI